MIHTLPEYVGMNPVMGGRRAMASQDFYRIDSDHPKDRWSWLQIGFLTEWSTLPWVCLVIGQLYFYCIMLVAHSIEWPFSHDKGRISLAPDLRLKMLYKEKKSIKTIDWRCSIKKSIKTIETNKKKMLSPLARGSSGVGAQAARQCLQRD